MEIAQKRAEDVMRNTFERLMRLSEGSQVRQLGIVFDLAELIHMMWCDGLTTNEHGQVFNFNTTVNLLYKRLNLPSPRKLNTVINNVRRRRSPDLPLLTHCRHLVERGEEPLGRFIKEKALPSVPPQRGKEQLALDFELCLF